MSTTKILIDENGIPTSLYLIRGDDSIIEIQDLADDKVTPIDLTGCTIKSQIRSASNNGYVIIDYIVTWINQAQGHFTLTCPASKTKNIILEQGVWDIQKTDLSGLVTTITPPSLPVEIARDASIT